jgi:hypothetical protein
LPAIATAAARRAGTAREREHAKKSKSCASDEPPLAQPRECRAGPKWEPALARWEKMAAVRNVIVQLGAGAQEPTLVDTRIEDARRQLLATVLAHQHDAEIAVAVRETESGRRGRSRRPLTRAASCSASYWTAASSTRTFRKPRGRPSSRQQARSQGARVGRFSGRQAHPSPRTAQRAAVLCGVRSTDIPPKG